MLGFMFVHLFSSVYPTGSVICHTLKRRAFLSRAPPRIFSAGHLGNTELRAASVLAIHIELSPLI